MAMDGLVIHAVAQELQACIGGRINKIYQPSDNDILLHIRTQGINQRLLISANPTYPRMHLTENQFINPADAPMFCMLLRKHCESGMIEAVEQIGLERIIHLHIRQRNELGDIQLKKIVVELMGRHSNIILLDSETNTVLDGIHHVTPAISSYRIVMPGSAYVDPPNQHKANPLTVNETQFISLMQEHSAENRSFAQTIVDSFDGISPLAAKEIVFQSDTESKQAPLNALWKSFDQITRRVREHRYESSIITTGTGKMYFSVIPLRHIEGQTEAYRSISTCLEAFYGDKAERDTVKQRVSDLLRFLQNERNKNVKKIEKLEETLHVAMDADKYRIQGELLTASMHLIKRGEKAIEVVNYYDEAQNTITINLDPLLSPSDNAQKYFKKYTKSKNSLQVVRAQIDAAKTEIVYLDTLLQQLNHASLSDIAEIREELVEQGYLKPKGKISKHKKKKNAKPVLHCFTSSEGASIFVGKNNIQNEYLTNRLAAAGDTWFHTKDIPGSHVVIRGSDYGEATLHEAAQLAAYFSQAKESSSVPVDYTLIRHVRKPSGAKPGFVIYEQQKTLFVTPDERLIKSLKVTLK